MINFNFEIVVKYKAYQIFVQWGESETDLDDLTRLASQLKVIARLSKVTGLRLITDFWYKDNFVVILQLGEKIEFSESDLSQLLETVNHELERNTS